MVLKQVNFTYTTNIRHRTKTEKVNVIFEIYTVSTALGVGFAVFFRVTPFRRTRHRNLLPPLEGSIKSSFKHSAEPRDFFLFHKCSRLSRGPNNFPFNSNWVSFPGVKRPGRDVDHSCPSSA